MAVDKFEDRARPSGKTGTAAELDGARSSTPRPAHEVGSWTLDYLGPGFHAQVRIARRGRAAHVGGWMSPAAVTSILLVSLTRSTAIEEATVSSSGRFEFRNAPTGPCRLIFLTSQSDAEPMTPPFWI